MAFVEYLRIPDQTTVELMTVPVMLLVVLFLSLLAGLRWHAALFATACILGFCVMGWASQRGALSTETTISAAIAAMLIVIFWKLKSRKRA